LVLSNGNLQHLQRPSTSWTYGFQLPLRTIQEELDDDIQIPVVDESTYPTQEGFVSEEPANESLATMMEQEIARVVGEWRAGIGVFSSTSTSGPSIVTEMEHDLA
jgi:hypothetical protein